MNTFSLNGNYIDLIIIFVLLYFIAQAFRHGVILLLADFVSFFASLLISLRAYKFTAVALRQNFSLSHSLANALGFLLTAIAAEAILGILLGHFVAKIPERIWKNKRITDFVVNKLLGIIPALGEGIVLVAFALTLTLGLPIAPAIKKDVTDSKIGSYILKQTSGLEKVVNEIFGGVIEDSLTYLTIKPESRERIELRVESQELKVDAASEVEMLKKVNEERRKLGITELTWAPEIVAVARIHAGDMWERKYFSHISPDGKDAGDRLEEAKIKYAVAGENLALAPTVATAHTGLMNSEGHRENILEQRFNRIGIGVIDNGVYGKMFVQVFTD